MITFLYTEPRFFAYALMLTKCKQDAEDIIQDVALRLLRYSDKPKEELERLASVSIKNRWIDLTKCHKHTYQLFEAYDSPVASYEKRLLDKEKINQVNKVLKTQSTKNQTAFTMRTQGYNMYEISDTLHENINTVLARVFRVRTLLKKIA